MVAHNFDRISYARELMTIAERYSAGWTATTAAVGIAMFQSCLGNRVQRILDSSRTLSLKAGPKNLVFLTSASLAGAITAGLIGAARNDVDEPRRPDAKHGANAALAANQENAVEETADEIRITGIVLKPDGTPADGAAVRAVLPPWARLDGCPESKLGETTADTAGHFTVTFSKRFCAELRDVDMYWQQNWKSALIVAQRSGFGPAWTRYSDAKSSQSVTLRLVEDSPIHGQVINLEGKPVAGANVRIVRIMCGTDDTIVPKWIKATQENMPVPWSDYFAAWTEFDPKSIGISDHLTTDESGRIEIRGLGRNRVANLTVAGEQAAWLSAYAVVRELQPQEQKPAAPIYQSTEPIFGANFQCVVSPSRPIDGIVVDAETGEPLPDVRIQSIRIPEASSTPDRALSIVSDRSGRFRLIGMPKTAGGRIRVTPNDQQPYFTREFDVPESAGIEPVTMKLELHRGIWITGQVIDKVTKAPVAGVWMQFHPFRSNSFAERLPEFDDDGNVDGDENRYKTDQNGNYRLVGLPGRSIIGARSVLKGYLDGVGYSAINGPTGNRAQEFLTWGISRKPSPKWPSSMREITIAESEQQAQLDLQLDPGQSVSLRLVDEHSRDVKDAEISGLNSMDWYQFVSASDQPIQTVTNLRPDEQRILIARQKERRIGRVIQLSSQNDAGREVTVALVSYATISGRLLENGEPIVGAEIGVKVATPTGVRPQPFSHDAGHVTDREGRFHFELPIGCEYELSVTNGPNVAIGSFANKLTLKAGQAIELRDLNLGKDQVFRSVNRVETK